MAFVPRRVLVGVLGIVLASSAAVCACHRPDPNTPEGRAAIEREQKRKDDAEARKRAKQEAKERDREERNRRAAERPSAAAVPSAASPQAESPAAGTCGASCQHYLQCKRLDGNVESQQRCVAACERMKLTTQQLAGFERTDCVSAIAIVEGQNGKGSSSSSARSSACTGCVWDGSSCIWMSSSNWGAGPYSGAYSACDAACCRR